MNKRIKMMLKSIIYVLGIIALNNITFSQANQKK